MVKHHKFAAEYAGNSFDICPSIPLSAELCAERGSKKADNKVPITLIRPLPVIFLILLQNITYCIDSFANYLKAERIIQGPYWAEAAAVQWKTSKPSRNLPMILALNTDLVTPSGRSPRREGTLMAI